MPIVLDGPVLPADLTVFTREVPIPATIALDQILPNKEVPYNRVDVGQLTKTNRTARFRAYDGGIHRTQRDAASLQTVHLPPLSDSIAMGELERLQLEFARTGGTNQDVFVNAIYDDATNLTQNVQRRMEMARGDVLTDGKFDMNLPGELSGLEADFGLPSGNQATAGTLWSDHANSDPIADLTTWIHAYRTSLGNGYSPAGMWLSFDVLQHLLANVNIRTSLGSILGAPLSVGQDQLGNLMQSRGLPPIAGIYDSQFDVDGTATRALPDNVVLLVPPDPMNNLGYTAWGVSATALELVQKSDVMSFEDAPGIVGVVVKDDAPPFHQNVYVDAVGMPVLENPRALFVATVA